jgi:hypothetical protein
MTINNYTDLMEFMRINYDKLSNEDYKRIMRETMLVYEYSKPSTLEETLERVETHGKYLESLPANHEPPLFIVTEHYGI